MRARRAGPVWLGIGVVMAVAAAAAVPATAAMSTADEGPPRHIGFAEGSPHQHTPAGHNEGRQSVTLITGDRVDLAGGTARITPGAGRSGIGFAEAQTEDGHYRVVPSDAMPLLAAGKLDPRLFDVTALLRAGYGDARRKDLPLIVASAAGARTATSAPGVRVTRQLRSIRGQAVRAAKANASAFWTRVKDTGVSKVWLDGPVKATIEQSVPQIGAPQAWQAGFTGKGVTVAVLDTGIDAVHPDLDDAILEARDFTETSGPTDYVGHGTHVASIITGSGEASGGTYTGVAPDAQLLVGKVLDDGGYGYDSQIIAGMEWAVAEGARVVNMSLGGCATDGTDPLSQAVDTITEQSGALFVVAAGNHPSNPYCFHDERVSTPAVADSALAVASVTKQDELSEFSNIGPRLGDSAVKPDLSAPGEGIVAARAAEGSLGEPVGDHYTRVSGTSMAAPHVAGAAALLAQQHPDWKAGQLRAALMAAATPNPELSVFQQGAGRVDLARAIEQDVLAQPASLSFGRAEWPHDDDEPVTEQLTYRNTGTAAVTLDLSISGNPPAGMFTLEPAQVTIPAGGVASVDVTADTRVESADGLHSAWVTASAAGRPVIGTPAGVDKEVESYDLTVEAIDRNGESAFTEAYLTETATGQVRTFQLNGGPTTLRLPKGRYDLSSVAFTFPPDEGQGSATLLAHPDLLLDQDRVAELDARQGLPVSARVDSRTAEPVGQRAAWVDNGPLRMRVRADPGDPKLGAGELFATPTARVTGRPYAFGFTGSLNEPEPSAGSTRKPRGYLLHLTTDGQIPDPPTFRVRDRHLAAVHTGLYGQGVATARQAYLGTSTLEDGVFGVPLGYDVRIPGRRIDFYSAGPDLPWGSDLTSEHGSEIDYFGDNLTTYQPGRHDRSWGKAAIGPLARPSYAYDRLWASVSGFAPSAAGHFFSSEPSPGITVHTTLEKNGEIVGENDQIDGGTFDVPIDEAATYALTTQATRTVDWANLATRVEGRWTFRGPFADFEGPPLLAVRLDGDFDILNRAPGSRPFPLRVVVENVAGPVPEVTRLEVAASFDDGRTWKPLEVRPDGDGAYAVTVPKAPTGAGFVSLRASAADATGNQVEQTAIRSYQLKK